MQVLTARGGMTTLGLGTYSADGLVPTLQGAPEIPGGVPAPPFQVHPMPAGAFPPSHEPLTEFLARLHLPHPAEVTCADETGQ